jgi:ParB family chromosome partitioning protein
VKFRPEANIWPIMPDAELQALAEDIDANGQRYPISLLNDEILDGRNRWLAITKHGKRAKPIFETVHPDSPIAFVISSNEKRRHLSDSQRGYCAAQALPFFEAEARKRQTGRPQAGKSGPIGPQLKHRARDDAAVAFGTSPRNVQRGKAVADKGSKKLKEAVATGQLSLGKAEQIIRTYDAPAKQDAQVAAIAKSKMVSRVKGLTGEVEWYTPRRYLDAVVQVMGAIDLDPASSAAAQKHVKAARWFTRETDGLAQPWSGRVFLNPPYAMPFIKQFTSKIVECWQAGSMTEGILLTNNATDTEWFHNTLEGCSALCLTRGRIQFLEARDGELTEKVSPTHGQAFFYFGPHVERFAETFGEFGAILRRYQRPTQLKVAA